MPSGAGMRRGLAIWLSCVFLVTTATATLVIVAVLII